MENMRKNMKYNKILLVIDMQNDFISGSLKVPNGKKVTKEVVKKIQSCKEDTFILLTQDTHKPNYLNTKEGKHLPIEHCIEGTKGHEIISDILVELNKHPHYIWKKENIGDYKIAEYIKTLISDEKIVSIEIVGVCTDICVITNALLLNEFFNQTQINIIEDCCQGSTEKSHQAAIEIMQKNLIDIL